MANSGFHFPEVKLLRASAGSGKTYQLTKRYVQLLFVICRDDASSLKEVLAITFTNKAAHQMKARILEFLKRASLEELADWEQADILAPVGLTARQASPLAARLMDYILREYHYFAVQTIDSFVNALLAGCAFKIGLSAKFRIRRNAFDYLQLGLDELLLHCAHDKQARHMFDQFVRQYLFLENRGGWLPKDDLLQTIHTLYRQANTYGLPLKADVVDNDNLWADKRKLYDILLLIHTENPAGMKKRFADALNKFIEQSADGYDIDDISDYFAHPEFPALKNVQISDYIMTQWNHARQLLEEICAQEAFGVFNPYIQIYNALMVSFSRLQAKDDVLFLEQLNQKARDLFDKELVTVAELYYRLASRFRHYLIDEFQDTNKTQWNNLKMMVEEALSSDGSLFLVADAKQAIYGFRGGDSLLFDGIANDYKSLTNIQTLDTNRRSQRAIVEFNNHIFSPDNLCSFINAMRLKNDVVITPDDEKHIMHVFDQAQQQWREDAPHGCVRVVNVLGASEERHEATREYVLSCVEQARQRFVLGDIAVIVRSNAQVELVTGWLMQHGIAVESERTSDILTHPIIEELVAFLRFVYNPVDNIAFSRFLLGQVAPKAFSCSHQMLADFCFANRPSKAAIGAEAYLYKAFAKQYPDIWEHHIQGFLTNVGHFPLYELMVGIYRTLRVQEHFPDALGFCMHFLEIIKIKEEETVDAGAFLEYFDRLEDELRFIPLPKMDALRVLTVHKSKGLEFPVVILPFLEMPLKVGAGGREGHQSFSLLINDESMSLVRLKKKYAQFSPALNRLWNHEFNKSLLNEMCVMYVALTRAVWEMYVFIPAKSGNAFNPAMVLIAPEFWQAGDVHEAPLQETWEATPALDPLPLSDWMPLLREDSSDESHFNREARLNGELWHNALSKITVISDDNQLVEFATKALCRAYQERGLSTDNFDKDIDRFISFLKRVDVRLLFLPALGKQVLCETDIVNRYGDLKRIDRLIFDNDHIMVIDFKTSAQGETYHQAQLNEYCVLVKAIYPDKVVDGCLVYFDGGLS